MSASAPPLSSLESALFQAMSKAGLVYLLMLRLKRPIGAREIGDILGIHEQTASSYLRRLAKLNLVARCGRKRGYVVLGGWQLVLEDASQPPPAQKALPPALDGPQEDPQVIENTAFFSQYPVNSPGRNAHEVGETQDFYDHSGASIDAHAAQNAQDRAHISADTTKFSQYLENTTKKSQYPVNNNNINTDDINLINDINDSEELLLLIDDTSKNSQYGVESEHAAVWQELFAAGINRNPRTRALVSQPHITPEYVRAHRLNQEACGRTGTKWAGLLVMILESGEPAPELNPNGHLADCDCTECYGYRMARSWEEP